MDELVKNGLVFDLLPGTIIDTAGNKTVTNNGATLTADHNGRANRAWAFDGTSNITIPKNAIFQTGINTIEISAKSNSESGVLLDYGYKSTATIGGIRISYSTGGITINIASNVGLFTWNPADGLTLTYNNWNHIAMSIENYSTNNVKFGIYINGILKLFRNYGSAAYLAGANQDIKIGSSLNGSIDLCKINGAYFIAQNFQKDYNYWRSH